MHLVVDKNFLRSSVLENFLKLSPDNFAVLTEYLFIETYSPGSIDRIQQDFSLLSRYPAQVVVLKSTRAISELAPSKDDLRARLIDDIATNNFPTFCEQLASKHPSIVAHISHRQQVAAVMLLKLTEAAREIRAEMDAEIKKFTGDERRRLKRKETLSPEFHAKLLHSIKRNTGLLIGYTGGAAIPGSSDARYSFQCRFTVCTEVLQLYNAATAGEVRTRNINAMRNDITDMTYLACATFFDGLLSEDKRSKVIFAAASDYLKSAVGI